MAFEWDPQKAEDNFAKHGVHFAETAPVFEDDYAIVITDDESDQEETRFVALGTGALARILVVVYLLSRTQYPDHFRAIGHPARTQAIRGKKMKKQYDFSRGKRGRITTPVPQQSGKTRITIRIDDDVLEYFLKQADASGGSTGYQTLINEALRLHAENKAPKLEDTLRRIFREELRTAS